eukprot:TRINITY_DN3698_c0_g1_i1.p1 TRINITY_DN3698_c0_g1~~TRINITY_DN3698_c0_g1_i1.p1  ORF type:complete len:386 (-),score=48.37 TRINITY_DN3698_c0_g1_i1:185-1342(-)
MDPLHRNDGDIDFYTLYQDKPELFVGEQDFGDIIISRKLIDSKDESLKLYYTNVRGKNPLRASICMVHGFSEHSTRYLNLAAKFALEGLDVHLIDLRGFGYSGGARANGSLEEFHKDVLTLLSQASKDLPLFLFCHSLGCAISASLLSQNPNLNIRGVILSCPYFDFHNIEKPMPKIKRVMMMLLGQDLQDVMCNSNLNTSVLTKRPDFYRRVFEDRLMAPILTLRYAKFITEAAAYNIPNAKKFTYPVFIFQGMKDKISNPKDVELFHKRIGSQDATLKMYENGYHEPLFDSEAEEILAQINYWVGHRINGAKPFGDLPQNIKIGSPIRWYHLIHPKIKLILVWVVLYIILMKWAQGKYKFKAPFKIVAWPLSIIHFYLTKKRA